MPSWSLICEISLPAQVFSHLTPTLHQKLLDKHGSGSLLLMSEHTRERKFKVGVTEGKSIGTSRHKGKQTLLVGNLEELLR